MTLHPADICRVGFLLAAAVDPFQGARPPRCRVMDAFIMPQVVGGNTNAALDLHRGEGRGDDAGEWALMT